MAGVREWQDLQGVVCMGLLEVRCKLHTCVQLTGSLRRNRRGQRRYTLAELFAGFTVGIDRQFLFFCVLLCLGYPSPHPFMCPSLFYASLQNCSPPEDFFTYYRKQSAIPHLSGGVPEPYRSSWLSSGVGTRFSCSDTLGTLSFPNIEPDMFSGV